MRGLLVLIFLLPADCQEFVTGEHNYVGCFLDNTRARDLPYRASGLREVTVRTCLEWCQAQYYQYAGLQAASQCWCGASYGSHGPGQCEACPGQGEEGETCGGQDSSSVYRTEVRVPGPPASLPDSFTVCSSLLVQFVTTPSNFIGGASLTFVHKVYSFCPRGIQGG